MVPSAKSVQEDGVMERFSRRSKLGRTVANATLGFFALCGVALTASLEGCVEMNTKQQPLVQQVVVPPAPLYIIPGEGRVAFVPMADAVSVVPVSAPAPGVSITTAPLPSTAVITVPDASWYASFANYLPSQEMAIPFAETPDGESLLLKHGKKGHRSSYVKTLAGHAVKVGNPIGAIVGPGNLPFQPGSQTPAQIAAIQAEAVRQQQEAAQKAENARIGMAILHGVLGIASTATGVSGDGQASAILDSVDNAVGQVGVAAGLEPGYVLPAPVAIVGFPAPVVVGGPVGPRPHGHPGPGFRPGPVPGRPMPHAHAGFGGPVGHPAPHAGAPAPRPHPHP